MAKYSIDELARQVMAGKWGIGAERKKRLTEAGYDYDAVQSRVNENTGITTTTAPKAAAPVESGNSKKTPSEHISAIGYCQTGGAGLSGLAKNKPGDYVVHTHNR